MTYLGTRPILPDELEQYELHHRARIAIKPGITGMWQVSGRKSRLYDQKIESLNNKPKLRAPDFTWGQVLETRDKSSVKRV